MFKGKSKNTRTTLMKSFWCIYRYLKHFTPFSSVSVMSYSLVPSVKFLVIRFHFNLMQLCLGISFQIRLSPSKKCCFYFLQQKTFLKNDFYFVWKTLSALEILKLLSWFFGYVEKRPGKKVKVNFKFHDVTDWTTNNYSKYIFQYLKK